MIGNSLINNRTQGVRVPENQSTETAPAMKVTQVARMETVLLEWGNERGQKETSIGFVVGNKVYVPPQYGIWTSGFRPLVDVLSKQAIEMLETSASRGHSAAAPAIPTSDDVDITGAINGAFGTDAQ